jgi:hypothetical protein
MQKWEHHLEIVTALTKMDDPDRSEVYKKVRQLGQNGWEMVSLVAHRGDLFAAFKRPVEEAKSSGVKSASQQMGRGRIPGREQR